jgi:hypothetical protein
MNRRVIAVAAALVGAFSVIALIIPGTVGMIACGALAVIAVVLGTVSLAAAQTERIVSILAVLGVTLGTFALTAQFILFFITVNVMSSFSV